MEASQGNAPTTPRSNFFFFSQFKTRPSFTKKTPVSLFWTLQPYPTQEFSFDMWKPILKSATDESDLRVKAALKKLLRRQDELALTQIDNHDPYAYSVLHSASAKGLTATVTWLLSLKKTTLPFDVTSRSPGRSLTPLHLAAQGCLSVGVVNALLTAGADPLAQDSIGRTPLGEAYALSGDMTFRVQVIVTLWNHVKSHQKRVPVDGKVMEGIFRTASRRVLAAIDTLAPSNMDEADAFLGSSSMLVHERKRGRYNVDNVATRDSLPAPVEVLVHGLLTNVVLEHKGRDEAREKMYQLAEGLYTELEDVKKEREKLKAELAESRRLVHNLGLIDPKLIDPGPPDPSVPNVPAPPREL